MSRIEHVIPLIKQKTIRALLEKGERLDGRKPMDFRDVEINVGVIDSAEGSAIVNLGNTMVIAGVKLGMASPFPDSPNSGALIVNAELIPLASPLFEYGPPKEEDIEISRVVDRGIRSSKLIDLEKLVIVTGRKVWFVYVDLYALNHDGNLLDACMLAAVSALLTARKPKTRIEGDHIEILDEKEPIPIGNTAISITFAKIGEYVVVDPTYEEELAMDARLTICYDKEGRIVAIQKGGSGYFTSEEVIDLGKKGLEISRKLISKLPTPLSE
ncbi:MAG: RNA-binding protein [Thermoprotei archaeon]|nr:MAG: RNA-binding protein [Thermoprotei archaeon]RLE89623.1 MAG: RNA-binding protein [Thermoprotei archaeon]